MNHKILSFLMSLIFLFEVPTVAFAKSVNNNETVNKKNSGTSNENTINMIFSKIKNNIGSVAYTAITTGMVSFNLYLLYALLFRSSNTKPKEYRNVAQQTSPPIYSEAFTMTNDITQKIDMNTAPTNGIPNVRHSCYLNSMIQQLYRNDKFRNYILLQECISKINQPFTWAIHHIFCSIKHSIPMNIQDLHECLKMLGHRDFNQEDTDEYMRLIVDRCSEELNVPHIIDISNNADASLSQNGDRLIDIIKMGAPLNMDRVRQHVHETHPDLAENDKEFIRLQDEILKQPNPDNHNLPDIKINNGTEIIIPVNRTTLDGAGKNNSRLSIPFKLNLERDFGVPDDNKIYTLSCVTVHHGNSRNGGHYLVYKKTDGGKWVKINDDTVTKVEYSKIKKDIEENSTTLTYTYDPHAKDDESTGIFTFFKWLFRIR